MTRLAMKLLMAAKHAGPLDTWAVGHYSSAVDPGIRPIVYYKPPNQPWQLKYKGAELAAPTSALRFDSGSRFSGDARGTIWVGCFKEDSGHVNQSWAGYSSDFGATWSYAPLNLGFGLTQSDFVYGCCSPKSGNVVVGVTNTSFGNRTLYGTLSSLAVSRNVSDAQNMSSSPDYLFLPAAKSPNGIDTIVAAIRGEVLLSTDYGATFTTVFLSDDIDGTGQNNEVSDAIFAGHPKFNGKEVVLQAYAPTVGTPPVLPGGTRIIRSTDLVTWTVKGVAGSAYPAGLARSRNKRFVNMTATGAPIFPAQTSAYRSVDDGATWSGIYNVTLLRAGRMRYLGNRFYMVMSEALYSSSNAIDWTAETLPDAGVGTITLRDVFG